MLEAQFCLFVHCATRILGHCCETGHSTISTGVTSEHVKDICTFRLAQGSYQNMLKASAHSHCFPILELLALLGS